jgi:prepilin-type N-terminal cleavage/methylation domain-containing protein/prepilin-type processing-associated H-X9-DG protein
MIADHQREHGAFTLVELLVVIAIVALLATLLLPALSNAKAAGRLAKCKSNVHQLSLAMGMYTSDEGYYPYYLMATGLPTNCVSWYDALFPYTSSHWTDALYRCPNYPYRTRNVRYAPGLKAWIPPDGSYGYNWLGTGELSSDSGASILHLGLGAMAVPGPHPESSRKESDVVMPHDMAQLGDGGGGQISPPGAVAPDYRRFAHRTVLNMSFCDGHVETVNGYQFYQATPEARQRFNYDHQPHPETWDTSGTKGPLPRYAGPGDDDDNDHGHPEAGK